jgi:plastocyanin domain-containing protein
MLPPTHGTAPWIARPRARSRNMRLLTAALLVAAAWLGGCSSPKSGTREVTIRITEDGFEPAKQFVPRGVPVTLVVTRETDQTCATAFKIPSLGQRVELPLHQHVRIDLPGGIRDTLKYSCGMDMLHGTVIGN